MVSSMEGRCEQGKAEDLFLCLAPPTHPHPTSPHPCPWRLKGRSRGLEHSLTTLSSKKFCCSEGFSLWGLRTERPLRPSEDDIHGDPGPVLGGSGMRGQKLRRDTGTEEDCGETLACGCHIPTSPGDHA